MGRVFYGNRRRRANKAPFASKRRGRASGGVYDALRGAGGVACGGICGFAGSGAGWRSVRLRQRASERVAAAEG